MEKDGARGKDRKEGRGKKRKCVCEREREASTHAALIIIDPKIIENGSPNSLLNQTAASSVYSVIAESADRVVLRQLHGGKLKTGRNEQTEPSGRLWLDFKGKGQRSRGSCGCQRAEQAAADRFGMG